MTFRRVRRTNDWLGWLSAGACLSGLVPTGGMFATGLWFSDSNSDSGAGLLCFGSLAFLFAVVTGFTVWQLFCPQEWEFVVEDGVIRWGRTARPDGQQRVRLVDVRRVVNDWREQRLVVETVGDQTEIGDFVLIRKVDQLALLAFLKQHYPQVVVSEGW